MPKLRWKPLALAVAWTLFILVLLSIPSRRLPHSSLWQYDKLGHALLFFGLAFLWMRALSADSVRMILLILVCGLAFAPLTEWYQSILASGRQAELLDSVAGGAGFALGTLAWIVWEKIHLRLRSRQ